MTDRTAVSSEEQEQAALAPERRQARSRSSVGWLVVSVFLILLFLLGIRAYLDLSSMVQQTLGLPGRVIEEWRQAFPQPTPTVQVLPPALDQVRALARLQTTAYFLSTVVAVDKPPQWPFTEQRLLLVAHAQVTAGVDLSRIGETDVQVVGTRVVVHLPEAEVFDVFLREDQTYVYDYSRGIFARYDATLETTARRRAVEEFRQSALANGILADAQSRAEWEVQRLLLLLGYEAVDFR